MKTTTWMALGAWLGKRAMGGKRSTSDKILEAIMFKNEVLDHDGMIRKGMHLPPKEIARQQIEVEKELKRQRRMVEVEDARIKERCSQPGFMGGFWQGYYRRRS